MRNFIYFVLGLFIFASCEKDPIDELPTGVIPTEPTVPVATCTPTIELGELIATNVGDAIISEFVEIHRDTLSVATDIATTTINITSQATSTVELTDVYDLVEVCGGDITPLTGQQSTVVSNEISTIVSETTEIIDNPSFVEVVETEPETNDNSSGGSSGGNSSDNSSEAPQNASDDTPVADTPVNNGGNGGGSPVVTPTPPVVTPTPATPVACDWSEVTTAVEETQYTQWAYFPWSDWSEPVSAASDVVSVTVTRTRKYGRAIQTRTVSTTVYTKIAGDGDCAKDDLVVEGQWDLNAGTEFDDTKEQTESKLVANPAYEAPAEVECTYTSTVDVDVTRTEDLDNAQYGDWSAWSEPIAVASDVATTTRSRTRTIHFNVNTKTVTTTSYTKSDASCADKADDVVSKTIKTVESKVETETEELANPNFAGNGTDGAPDLDNLDAEDDNADDNEAEDNNVELSFGGQTHSVAVGETAMLTYSVDTSSYGFISNTVTYNMNGVNGTAAWAGATLAVNGGKISFVKNGSFIDVTVVVENMSADYTASVGSFEGVCSYSGTDSVEEEVLYDWNAWVVAAAGSDQQTTTRTRTGTKYTRNVTTTSYTANNASCDDKDDVVVKGAWSNEEVSETETIANPNYIDLSVKSQVTFLGQTETLDEGAIGGDGKSYVLDWDDDVHDWTNATNLYLGMRFIHPDTDCSSTVSITGGGVDGWSYNIFFRKKDCSDTLNHADIEVVIIIHQVGVDNLTLPF